jgi:signal transduction histidine kinase
MQNHRPIRPIAIILTTIIILGAAIYAALIVIARDGDDRQQAIEQTIMQSALNQVQAKLADTLVQNAYWDEAYDRVTSKLSVEWADSRLGVYSELTSGIPITVIYDENSRPIYQYRAKRLAEDVAALGTTRTMMALVERALNAPAMPPKPFTGFIVVNGRVYLGAAERIVPTDARKHRKLTRRFVLTYLLPFDTARLGKLAREFHIAPMDPASQPDPARASVALKDATERTIAYLNWTSARPGEEFANAAAPIAIACFVLVAFLQMIVLKGWMRAAQRLRDEGAAKTMFLANASHELRTPLNAILGFSECMLLELYGPMSPRYKEYANDIKMSGQHLLNIVNDVLDLSQLNNAEKYAIHPMKLSEAITQPLRMLREIAKARNVSINFADRSVGAEVAATEKALSQILLNLGSNAVKFSPAQGAVSVTLSRSSRADFVEIIVRDKGPGIPESKLRLIGQPFFQAHADTAKQGSGLGLAIVKSLVGRLNGELEIESTVGYGTTVIVRLPLYRGQREPATSQAAA